ncbi:hypothetical protein AQI95_23955 [Streptomyces yokosukanensis]|uniref:Uncharacterized protein n=1 Tax=Streptomyces yokosukanensis TaxID=67386 RepID=A0A101P268_9ACTN|nr:hypothetical protein [Streptomyces yokosukanensis]KUN03543.1 hypothetical protein AQI95_23955 [Streptomyces yokosukanensis]
MTQIHEVPDDWNPDHRCCLECGNSDPEVTLRAVTHAATNQQALACTRHIAEVGAVLSEADAQELEYGVIDGGSPWSCRGEVEPVQVVFGLASWKRAGSQNLATV